MKKCVQTRELHELPYTEMVKYGDYLTRLWNCIYKLHENYIITKVTKHSGIASGSPTLHCFIKFANITSHQGNKPKKMLILLLITGTCPLPTPVKKLTLYMTKCCYCVIHDFSDLLYVVRK